MSFPFFPVWFVDFFGSISMIVFAFLCIDRVRCLRQSDSQNILWTYFLWFCYALATFSVSRSVGHILQHILVVSGRRDIWILLQPYSGALNTITFVIVGSITLFFERIWKIYNKIVDDQQALQEAHSKLVFMNRHLEDIVRKRTRELHVSERKYRNLFEQSQDIICIVSSNNTILDMNPRGLAILKLATHDLGIADFKAIFWREEEFKMIWEQIQKEGSVANLECRLHGRTSSEEITVLLSGIKETEWVERYVFWLRDISQRKLMEKQLLQADKLSSLGRLAAGVAHEINNPLGIVLGYTQLLLRSVMEGGQLYEDLKTIEKHARMCKTIVEDLLKFSRIGATQKQFVKVNDVVNEVIVMMDRQLKSSGIRLEKQFDPSVPDQQWDVNKMKQVFINLLVNARDGIGDKRDGLIRVKTENSPKGVYIYIEDNGCGIDPDALERIFDPFFTTKPPGQGTGLGLSVSYGIVTDHGGDIAVKSRPGEGTTFILIFPKG